MIPGYYTTTQAAAELGMSRQNFHQSGLAAEIPAYVAGRTRLHASADIDRWRTWLTIRQGLVALGIRPYNSPLNIGHAQVVDVVDAGEWVGKCHICDGWAVTDTRLLSEDTRTWCPEHGVQDGALA